ncbi:hypothetical protein P691DRAFT_772481 [Macrolepiota fuliginosa MF-IS2]|uniref:Uncharacterized protein n=1 Tax=Macrolepiota fuliginosa MF-IS2 TaxID=1400762 RepID=A0A9P6C8D4_9AGAR|nr:hypothetical protein P691DRAFT_772481 [Macrolepiota fuliginosa MF-IS2]
MDALAWCLGGCFHFRLMAEAADHIPHYLCRGSVVRTAVAHIPTCYPPPELLLTGRYPVGHASQATLSITSSNPGHHFGLLSSRLCLGFSSLENFSGFSNSLASLGLVSLEFEVQQQQAAALCTRILVSLIQVYFSSSPLLRFLSLFRPAHIP